MILTPYFHNGLPMLIHPDQRRQSEIDIIIEVQREYFWDFPLVTAIDVGAHIGSWARYAYMRNGNAIAEGAPLAHIIAVEVEPSNYEALVENTYGKKGITAVHARAGYEPGEFMIARDNLNSGSTFVYRAEEADTVAPLLHRHDVLPAPPPITIEDLMALGGFDTLDVLKMDCEGSEIDILNHISDDCLMRIKRIVGEIHSYPSLFIQQTDNRLQKAGFKAVFAPHPGDPNLFYIHAFREDI